MTTRQLKQAYRVYLQWCDEKGYPVCYKGFRSYVRGVALQPNTQEERDGADLWLRRKGLRR